MPKLDHRMSNRLVGKSEYLLITYKLTEFIIRIEARYNVMLKIPSNYYSQFTVKIIFANSITGYITSLCITIT